MDIADIITGIITSKDDIKTSLQNKGQTVSSSDTLNSLAKKINNLSYSNKKGGCNRVVVIDYDGVILLDEYYVSGDIINLSPAKALIYHKSLAFDYWVSNVNISAGANSDLVSTLTVPEYNDVIIAPVYHTVSGKTEFDVTVNANSQVIINGTGTFDWGDGTTDSNSSHIYTTDGNYTILFDGSFTSTPYINNFCTEIRFANTITAIDNGFILNNSNLERLSLPPGLVTLNSSTDLGGMTANKLKNIIFPKTVTALGNSAFRYLGNNSSYAEKYALLPYGLTDIGTYIGADINNTLYCPIPQTITNSTYTTSIAYFKDTVLSSKINMPVASFTVNNSFLKEYAFNKADTSHIIFTNNVPELEDYCFYTATVEIYDFTLQNNVPVLGSNVFPASGDYVIRVNADIYSNWQQTLQGYYAQTRLQAIHVERNLYDNFLDIQRNKESIIGALKTKTYENIDSIKLSECSDIIDNIDYRLISTKYYNNPNYYSGQGINRYGPMFENFATDLVSAINNSTDWEIYIRTRFPSSVANVLVKNTQNVFIFMLGDFGWEPPNRHRFNIYNADGELCHLDGSTYLIFPYLGDTEYECKIIFKDSYLKLMRRVSGETNWVCLVNKYSNSNIYIGNTTDVTWGESGNSQSFYLNTSYIKVNNQILWGIKSANNNGLCYMTDVTPITYNITQTGGTLSNNSYTGSSGAYLTLSYLQTYDYDRWQFEFSYKYVNNGQKWNCIIGQYSIDNSGYTLNVMDGYFAINALNNSNSWIFADANTDLYPVENTTYYIRCGYENNTYFFDYKLNPDDTYTRQWTYSSNEHNYQNDSNICIMGSNIYSYSRYNPGTMDMNTFKFYGNGQLLWYKDNITIS